MNYKIVGITDWYDRPKEDKDAINRIGRVVTFEQPVIIGRSLFLLCVSPSFLKSIMTSPVKDVISKENVVIIITMNSKYYLEKCYE